MLDKIFLTSLVLFCVSIFIANKIDNEKLENIFFRSTFANFIIMIVSVILKIWI
jgi:hypothetical protein